MRSSIVVLNAGVLRKALIVAEPKKKAPSALGARRRAEEATELCLALCGCLAR